jgi:hypothetical protein
MVVPNRVLDAERPAPRHPARTISNRRQVSWLAGHRPSPPSRVAPVALWHGLAAYSCGGSCGIGTWVPHRIPCWLSREKPSIAATRWLPRTFVNAPGPPTYPCPCNDARYSRASPVPASAGYQRERGRGDSNPTPRLPPQLYAVESLSTKPLAPAWASGRREAAVNREPGDLPALIATVMSSGGGRRGRSCRA